jgi:hypothetical protein
VSRIHLRLEGVPQDASSILSLAISEALRFCARPETFPVFAEFIRADIPEQDGALFASKLTPEVIEAIDRMLTLGAAADAELIP